MEGIKMKKTLNIIFALVLLVCFHDLTEAQVNVKKTAQTSMKFLSIPIGARGSAMGEAFSAVAGHSEAMYWNPAGIRDVDHVDISAHYNKWIADISYQNIAAVYNAESIGFFGLNVSSVNYGTFYGTRRSEVSPDGYVETGEFSPDAFYAGLTYARTISDNFSFGVNLKYIYQNLGSAYVGAEGGTTTEENKTVETKNSLLAFDLGVLYYTGYKDLRLAVVAQHLSKEVNYVESYGERYPLPYVVKAGLAMDILPFFLPENSEHVLTVAFDVLHPRDYSERVHFGFEYVFNEILAVRGGYKFNYDEDNLSIGIGVMPIVSNVSLRFDYAYNPFGVFDGVHRISFGTAF
jgi:hypothetical protein